jgi:NADH-quinone oxidoreductase subunit M
MQQYLLTILILLPVAGALALVGHNFAGYKRETHFRWIALLFSLATFALSLLLLGDGGRSADRFRFVENVEWINSIGARYHLGVDGISLWLVLLTTLLVPISILSSWNSIKKRPLAFYDRFAPSR